MLRICGEKGSRFEKNPKFGARAAGLRGAFPRFSRCGNAPLPQNISRHDEERTRAVHRGNAGRALSEPADSAAAQGRLHAARRRRAVRAVHGQARERGHAVAVRARGHAGGDGAAAPRRRRKNHPPLRAFPAQVPRDRFAFERHRGKARRTRSRGFRRAGGARRRRAQDGVGRHVAGVRRSRLSRGHAHSK